MELTLGRARLQSLGAVQRATIPDVSQPLSVTESTTTSPCDDIGDSNIALDLASSLTEGDFHTPIKQLDHAR